MRQKNHQVTNVVNYASGRHNFTFNGQLFSEAGRTYSSPRIMILMLRLTPNEKEVIAWFYVVPYFF